MMYFRDDNNLSGSLPGRQRGVNLIELMISLTISLIVLSGASVILVSANKSSRLQEELISMQENARFAMQQISFDLQLGGYYGCVQDTNPLDPAGPVIYKLDADVSDPATSIFIRSPVRGYEHSVTPESALTDDNRDVLEIQYANPVTELSADLGGLQSAIPVVDASEFSVNDVLMIANCEFGDIFTVSGIAGDTLLHQTNGTSGETLSPANTTDSLSAWYPQQSYVGTNTRIYSFNRVKYYVSNDHNGDGDVDDPGEDVPALFRTVNRGRDESGTLDELFMMGVEAMEVLYGEDLDGNSRPDVYRDAEAVGIWGNVTAVRFALLVRSDQEYGSAADQDTNEGQTIDVLGTDFTAGEERVRRRLFQSTVYLRNSI